MERRGLIYVSLLLIASLLSVLVGLSRSQVYSVTIFSGLIFGTLLFWRFRLAFAFMSIAVLLASGLLDIQHLVEFASLDIILFLVGMMTVIGFLEERRFFEILMVKVIHSVGYDVNRFVISMMLMAALFAALVDEVTSILFITSTMLHVAGRYRVNPVPFIMMLVFATNIGSSATVVGNPVGVMIALKADLTFSDFLRWASPISIVSLILTIPITMKIFSKEIKELGSHFKEQRNGTEHSENNLPFEPSEFLLSLGVFLGTILSLILHHQIEELFHLERNSMLLGTALGAAGVVLIIDREKARTLIEMRVDWWTLSFFMVLFASVGTLRLTGVTGALASSLLFLAGGNETWLFASFTIIAAILSAFMDNVLAVATFIPIIHDLQSIGVYVFPLWWGALFAGTFFGNLTMIGSTANIVAVGMLERRRAGHV
ncbi:MAG: SLC13 family permease, partial [Candidatus Bathyarchaeia archaeon]